MSFSRRSFLQMLGLGGMALAVEAKAGPLPLFGSDEPPTPDLVVPKADLLKGHFVVQRKGRIEKIPQDDPVWNKYGRNGERGVVPVARLTRTQVPGGGSLGDLRPYRLFVKGEFPEGVDPHVVYYKASHELRAKFAALSRARLMEIPPELRSTASLVTVVEMPIIASARWSWESDERQVRYLERHGSERRGFDVIADFRQGVRYSLEGLDTFQIYSEQGEFPIDVPSDIDMGLLMKMDREVLADGSLLISDPRKWQPSGRKSRLWRG
jgi:hypothetical protein